MAAFIDFYNPTNVEYFKMDPHQLGSDELQYELALRNMAQEGAPRTRANAITAALKIEAASQQPPFYLRESPYPIDRDLMQCDALCQWLEHDAKLTFIDSQTLKQRSQQCVHLMARLARIRFQSVDQMNKLHELQ